MFYLEAFLVLIAAIAVAALILVAIEMLIDSDD